MDHALDMSKPPPTSYRQTFRRHRKLFCLPVILGALAGAVFLFTMGKTYSSTASLWVDTNAPVPSSIGANTDSLAEPPASAEQGVLTELLSTRAFAASVAKTSLLGKSAGGAAAAGALLSNGQLLQMVPGGQVLQISYSASSPAMANSVLRAVVTQLREYSVRLSAQHNKAAVAYARQQVEIAEEAQATAHKKATAYAAQHPGLTQSDPTYGPLIAAENDAGTQVVQANTALSQAAGTANSGWSLQVIDPPTIAGSVPLRKKKIVEVILAGALGGALVSFLAVIALTPVKKDAWEDELPIGGPFAPDVPPGDPFRAGSSRLPSAPVQATSAPRGPLRLSLGDRRFQFRSPSAPSEEE